MVPIRRTMATSRPKDKNCNRYLFMVIGVVLVICSLGTISILYGGGGPNLRISGAIESPPDRQTLGRHTWTLLHHMAAKFDKQPSTVKQQQMTQFLHLFGELYPCEKCAAHFREMLENDPPPTQSNADLSLWLCKIHNEVNRRLEKPQFRCDLDTLKERWGDCGCFDSSEESEAT